MGLGGDFLSSISFVHLSDIHFVKSSNNPADIDRELRDAIITDLDVNAKNVLENVSGILVSGDIAFSGTKTEYEKAKKYLLEISDLFSISPSDIYCVPGNHDVDLTVADKSLAVLQAQSAIDEHLSIDAADDAFAKSITDYYYNDVLFEPLREYNEFSNRFNCNISAERISWSKDFPLDCGLKLCLIGITSCFVPNSRDRLVYIGQSQIPRHMPDTAVMLMCHHPPECWKFGSDIIDRINKRADVQLYGHMHMQSVKLDENNAVLFSGATHPQRMADWAPRYNWITVSSEIVDGDKILNIDIYPRILSESRDRFQADISATSNGIFIHHAINIDRKRRQDLRDPCLSYKSVETPKDDLRDTCAIVSETKIQSEVNERGLIYNFYELSVFQQFELLGKFKLISEQDKGLSIASALNIAIQRAKEQGTLQSLYNCIMEVVSKREEIV